MPVQRSQSDHYRYDPLGTRHASKHEGRRGPWSPQEDKLLKDLVEQHGAGNWVAIQNGIVSRTAKQCRERWHQNLDPKLNHDPITPEEGLEIDALVEKMGKRWADIARHLKGRSDNAVKNWWNGGESRRRREQARIETTFYQRPPYTTHQERYWPSAAAAHWSQPPVYYQSSYGPGPTLAPILPHSHEQSRTVMIPPPITIPGRVVPRDIPSPAVSLPSMTEDPSSPRSYTRRDSIQVHTPVFPTHYTPESMVRSTSDGSARSEGLLQYRPEVVHPNTSPKVSTMKNSRSLPGINDLFSSAPVARELAHLINNRPPPQVIRSYLEQVIRSPLQQVIQSPLETRTLRLPSFSNINRGH